MNSHTANLLHSLTDVILKIVCKVKYWHNVCIRFTIKDSEQLDTWSYCTKLAHTE